MILVVCLYIHYLQVGFNNLTGLINMLYRLTRCLKKLGRVLTLNIDSKFKVVQFKHSVLVYTGKFAL